MRKNAGRCTKPVGADISIWEKGKMAEINVAELAMYQGRLLNANDWDSNFETIVRWLTSGDYNASFDALACGNQLNMTGNKIINLSDGSNEKDAVNFGQLSNINSSLMGEINKKASKTFEDVSAEAKEKVCLWMMPDYSKATGIQSGYTVPKMGWIYMGGMSDGTSSFTINGTYFEVSWDIDDGQSRGNVFMPVSKGDVISSFSRIREARFIPCKGVV